MFLKKTCACPPKEQAAKTGVVIHDDNHNNRLRSVFKKFAIGTGSGLGGLLAGHAGCIITPLVLTASATTAATGGVSALALAFSSSVTVGGLYTWHRLRNGHASRIEKALVLTGALAGFGFSTTQLLTDNTPNSAMPANCPMHQSIPIPLQEKVSTESGTLARTLASFKNFTY